MYDNQCQTRTRKRTRGYFCQTRQTRESEASSTSLALDRMGFSLSPKFGKNLVTFFKKEHFFSLSILAAFGGKNFLYIFYKKKYGLAGTLGETASGFSRVLL